MIDLLRRLVCRARGHDEPSHDDHEDEVQCRRCGAWLVCVRQEEPETLEKAKRKFMIRRDAASEARYYQADWERQRARERSLMTLEDDEPTCDPGCPECGGEGVVMVGTGGGDEEPWECYAYRRMAKRRERMRAERKK